MIEHDMQRPGFWTNNKRAKELQKELNEARKELEMLSGLESLVSDI